MATHRLNLSQGNIVLRPVTPEDHRFLYVCATSPGNSLLWRYHGQIPPFEVFVNQLYADMFAHFIVQMKTGEPAGYVMAYGQNLKARHVAVGALIAEHAQTGGIGQRAIELFVEYLFDVWPLRGVYADVPEFVADPFKYSAGMNSRLPFVETGRRPGYHYHQGVYWDDVVFYLSRERWEELRPLTT